MLLDDEPECLPVEIRPEGVSLNDYDIRYDKSQNRITEIRHRTFGLVKFNSYKIDEECGYVRGSPLIIYTAKYKDDILNIIHIHVNDLSESVTIETAYVQDDQNLSDF